MCHMCSPCILTRVNHVRFAYWSLCSLVYMPYAFSMRCHAWVDHVRLAYWSLLFTGTCAMCVLHAFSRVSWSHMACMLKPLFTGTCAIFVLHAFSHMSWSWQACMLKPLFTGTCSICVLHSFSRISWSHKACILKPFFHWYMRCFCSPCFLTRELITLSLHAETSVHWYMCRLCSPLSHTWIDHDSVVAGQHLN